MILRYLDDTGASSPVPKDGFLPVYEGDKPQPTQCQQIVQDSVVRMADHWVQTYKLEPATMYTAGEWLELVGFGANQQPTLIYLKLQLQSIGKTSVKLSATEEYLNGVLALFATNPVSRNDWEEPPYQFYEVISDALSTLDL
jgi:hypothetical protein